MDVLAFNREAWDRQVELGNRWTVPAGPEVIAAARAGRWEVVLTPEKPVPRSWFPPLAGSDVLCLACGGGQQGPILAAAGARVTVLDNSPRQLAGDRQVAEREGLALLAVQGDMRDLGAFADASFDLVFHPCSNVFVPEVRPVWREAFRVLRAGGALLSGLVNPVLFLFDEELQEQGVLEVRHRIPYSDLEARSPDDLEQLRQKGRPLEFGHTLEDLLGGQLDAGFRLAGLFEDAWSSTRLGQLIPTFIATRAVKPRSGTD
ncbi:MAG TPA: class I SAM-dependent methyltransferase [Candidatus Saccharimonadales bacterium]|nr:class I SAM-dependent methyltransferase [Candidatus Saccharimonadales bacterium]